jgi:hypothetical protein
MPIAGQISTTLQALNNAILYSQLTSSSLSFLSSLAFKRTSYRLFLEDSNIYSFT